MSPTAPTFAAPRPLCAAVAAAVLAGCSGGNAGETLLDATPGAPSLGLGPPAPLLASRAVDRDALEPVVALADGRRIPMARVPGTELWSGTVQVRPSSVVVVDIEWRVTIDSRPLGLARAERRIEIDEDGVAVQLGATDYDYETGLDADGDGQFNLDELNASTDPFGDGAAVAVVGSVGNDDPASPDVPPDDVGTVDPGPVNGPAPGDGDGNGNGNGDEDDEDDDRDGDTRPDEVAIDLFVPRISRSDKPDIDGLGVVTGPDGRFGGEWAAAVQVDPSGQPLGVNRLMIDQGADSPDGTPWRRWAAMHDGKYLYVLVMVEDDGARIEDSPTIWEDDSLEVFIDGNRSRNASYGDDDDWHVFMGLLAPGTVRTANSNAVETWQAGPQSSGVGLELDFTTGPGVGPDGLQRPRYEQDVYELRIDLDSANIEIGRPFGFELQVNDDDDGGTRDSKWGWAHPSRGATDVDFTYLNPSYMGTLLLD